MVQTREARSVEKATTKEEVLRLIVQYVFEQANMPIFRKRPLPGEQEWALVVGAIGDRGGGKSGSEAVIAIVDHMIYGKRCASNIKIVCDIEIDDETAWQFGLNSGGVVRYESEDLEKDALLSLDDEKYYNYVLLIEEINVQYSNVRRFMSNTNVDFNEVCQQLRKLESSLLFNVIDEMFIDPQLRALTDIFLKTYDSALDVNNMQNRKPRGLDFMWKIYPMTGYLRGEQNKYAIKHKALDEVCFHFGAWRGIYNSMKHQEKGIYSVSTKDKNKKLLANISTESSPEMVEILTRYSKLIDIVRNLNGNEIERYELFEIAGIPFELETEADEFIQKALRCRVRWSNGQKFYRAANKESTILK